MALVTVLITLVIAAALIFALVKVKLKSAFKLAAIVVLVFDVLFGLRAAMSGGLIPTPGFVKALVPQKSQTFSGSIQSVANYDVPAQPVAYNGPPLSVESIPWNAVSALTVANGGPQTTSDSLVKKYSGLTLSIKRQDNYDVMKDNLVKFAHGWKNGDASQGDAFVIMMGDQWVSFYRSVRDRVHAEGGDLAVVSVVGFSNGEDKCMGKPLNGNPQNAKGALIAASPYDGDWDVCVKWASDNGIKVNVDNTTYDPDAINFSDADSFSAADDKFINSACEDRVIAHDGKKTSEKKHVCVDGVATWTPGDVAVVQRKGGLATWASTKDYNLQMPAVLIGNKDYMEKNRAAVVGLLRAVDRGAFQIRGGDMATLGRVNAAVFGTPGAPEGQAQFWSDYFPGKDIHDSVGNTVNVGGSRVIGLAEQKDYFGLTPGAFNTYKGVYDTYCDYDKTFYPKVVPDCAKYEDVVDTSFVQAALQGVNTGAAQSAFAESKSITQAVSNRAYHLEFETGSSRLTPSSTQVLNQIANSASQTGLRIRISGHTDNTGDSAKNLALSRQRAQSVAAALTALAPQTFPANRMEVQGYGDTSPTADNGTAEGRAKNRRVEITLGS